MVHFSPAVSTPLLVHFPPAVYNWLTEAINHSGGNIVLFYLRVLSKQKSATEKKDWNGIPEKAKTFLQEIISGTSYTAELGRVILASQIYFLFYLDTEWTKKYILPLLDWDIDSKRAQQAWHGYLSWGRWDNALLPDIMPLFEKTFSKLSSDLAIERDQNRFCEFMAAIAIHGTINPLQSGWLSNFLTTISAEDRKSWASHVQHQLGGLQENEVKYLWQRWLEKYWAERNMGRPCSLAQEELKEMIGWVPNLGAVFPDVVDKICISIQNTTNLDLSEHDYYYLYHQFMEKEIAAKHPFALIKLLKLVLQHANDHFWVCSEVEKLVKILTSNPNITSDDLRPICDELARLGCQNASNLLK